MQEYKYDKYGYMGVLMLAMVLGFSALGFLKAGFFIGLLGFIVGVLGSMGMSAYAIYRERFKASLSLEDRGWACSYLGASLAFASLFAFYLYFELLGLLYSAGVFVLAYVYAQLDFALLAKKLGKLS